MATTKHKRLTQLSPELAERLTDMEVKYMEARLNGATMQEATAATGLAPFAKAGLKIEKRTAEKCYAVFNREGVTFERIAKKISEMLEAKTTKFFADKGVVLDSREVEDHATQLKAAELALKVLGAMKTDDDADSTERQPERHSVRVVVDDVETARGLAELFASRGTTCIVADVDAEVHEDMG